MLLDRPSQKNREKKGDLCTLAFEQEIAHVVAEGAADIAAAVGQGTGETATVEGTKCVGAAETKRTVYFLLTFFF